eukprot:CAMPEP_0170594602 /NCGR_PEP_ID=MMETSP0224-20130122/14091_1 /TAXON_ID=285029 /ORGANISM="Togula jolla, Strain CCCM 725" /LENGTH=565 /DNA_ID=CAMNT_0010918677 /DNA_START=44 /DNA_END=1742 /DNA_ORIENTATION=+
MSLLLPWRQNVDHGVPTWQDATITSLAESIAEERRVCEEKDQEIAEMRVLVAKLDAAVSQQDEAAYEEQERIAGLEKTLEQWQVGQNLDSKIATLELALSRERQRAEAAESATTAEEQRAAIIARQLSVAEAKAEAEAASTAHLSLKTVQSEDVVEELRSKILAAMSELEESQVALSRTDKELASLKQCALSMNQNQDSLRDKLLQSAQQTRELRDQLAEELTLRQLVQGEVIAKERQLCQLNDKLGDALSKAASSIPEDSSESSNGSDCSERGEGEVEKWTSQHMSSGDVSTNDDVQTSGSSGEGAALRDVETSSEPGAELEQPWMDEQLPGSTPSGTGLPSFYRDARKSWCSGTNGPQQSSLKEQTLWTRGGSPSPVQAHLHGWASPAPTCRGTLTQKTVAGGSLQLPCKGMTPRPSTLRRGMDYGSDGDSSTTAASGSLSGSTGSSPTSTDVVHVATQPLVHRSPVIPMRATRQVEMQPHRLVALRMAPTSTTRPAPAVSDVQHPRSLAAETSYRLRCHLTVTTRSALDHVCLPSTHRAQSSIVWVAMLGSVAHGHAQSAGF